MQKHNGALSLNGRQAEDRSLQLKEVAANSPPFPPPPEHAASKNYTTVRLIFSAPLLTLDNSINAVAAHRKVHTHPSTNRTTIQLYTHRSAITAISPSLSVSAELHADHLQQRRRQQSLTHRHRHPSKLHRARDIRQRGVLQRHRKATPRLHHGQTR